MAVPDRFGIKSMQFAMLQFLGTGVLFLYRIFDGEGSLGEIIIFSGILCIVIIGFIGVLLGIAGIFLSPYKKWRPGMPETGPYNRPALSWLGVAINLVLICFSLAGHFWCYG